VQSIEMEEFASRVCKGRPVDDEGGHLTCYARIRTGRVQSRARVAASSIPVGEDAGALAEALRSRVLGLVGDSESPRAWLEVLVRGESVPYDSMVWELDQEDDLEAADAVPRQAGTTTERASAWLLARQGDALVRMAEQSSKRASEAERRSAELVERLAELKTEAALARIDVEGDSADSAAIAQALTAAAPIFAVVGAKLLGQGAPAPAAPPPQAAEAEPEPIDAAQLAEEIAGILEELDEEQRSVVLARLGGAA